MTRRFVAVVIEFADDEALADFQQSQRDVLMAFRHVMDSSDLASLHVHDRAYHVKPDYHAPYIKHMTVEGLTLRGVEEKWSDGADR